MTRDYLMDDIGDHMPAPVAAVPGTLVRPWSPSDYPFTRVQALDVLIHAANNSFHIDSMRAAYIHACIEYGAPSPLPVQLQYGSSLHGWAFLQEDGWRGGYATRDDAYRACKQFRGQV